MLGRLRLLPLLLILSLAWPAADALAQADPYAGRAVPRDRSDIYPSFAPLVKATAPAVVNIYTRRVVERSSPGPLFNDPFFRRFFGDMAPMLEPRRRQIENSLGSGVIVDPSGTIVTSAHVIAGSDEITVVLADRREFEARIAQVDERSDLAVLRVDPRGQPLPYLPLGDSDALEVGDLVLAIGNPFGVGQTVTSGIVSATARTLGITEYGYFIQTDAAINPGNSGGALINMAGQLIGVNTAIYSRSGGSQGIGFAIPSNLVRATLSGATAGGPVVRPWVGAETQPVTQDLAYSLGLDRPRGVLVNRLYPGGPLERAGVRVGDVITSVAGHAVDDPVALKVRFATQPVGSTADVIIWRQGRSYTVRVPVEPPPETPPRDATRIGGNGPFAGATVANLSPAVVEELQIEGAESGVVLLSVAPRSAAERLGFQPGDVIVSVNGREIRRVADLKALANSRASGWRIAVQRNGRLFNLNLG